MKVFSFILALASVAVVAALPQQTCDKSVCKQRCEDAGQQLDAADCWGEAPVCACNTSLSVWGREFGTWPSPYMYFGKLEREVSSELNMGISC
ncbi:hypothetical protein CkaCkLH20_03566 [Colletotrichum karsti]|uniref:Extracellular membrane protein CFEM domain-containing protein n=1 Tax=Colletotrichum karsti TaxID=1095194 RepID=A0A9P6IBC3_9PEZI|nr:uncharacterized protein CkaCkLH20_03566 [Colletotrichum karsti]KAF9878666.1 hypothetical protein CkaCkLH20_03566 [Colletotrichum karsti]